MSDKIVALRRELHRHPERSGQEQATAQRIRAFVQEHHPTEMIEGLGGHGLAAVYRYADGGPTVMIRCELDALPLPESSMELYRSVNTGVAHLCGHDGHMAMVAGLIFGLKEQAFSRGTVVLLFQPAEETGQGARTVLEDERFGALAPDYVFALHNIPDEPLGMVILIDGQFSATVQSVAIYLTGQASHASEPEKGRNPARAMADIIDALDDWVVPDLKQDNFALITPVHLAMGQPEYGISAGAGELHFTLRTKTEVEMQKLQEQVKALVERIGQQHQLGLRTEWFDYFPAVNNNEACNELVKAAAEHHPLKVKRQAFPYKFGEDFGWFSRRYPAVMFGLGAGEGSPLLHHTDYDFPDRLIPKGIALFTHIIHTLLTR